MPEFLTLLPPEAARKLLLQNLSRTIGSSEAVQTSTALGRVAAEDIYAPHPLPNFARTTVDGYAVRAHDTHGASESLPAYLKLIGEVPMGDAPAMVIGPGQCALIHTGGMIPDGSDAVVMLEYTQLASENEIEILRSVADGENLIRIGEDVAQGQRVLPKGKLIRPAEIGGLMALGVTSLRVVARPRVALLSTGDEVIDPSVTPRSGQVRDINSFTLGALVEKCGGEAVRYGIIPDDFESLRIAAVQALTACDAVIITAGSSASTRDMTAEVIRSLGQPGVLVHGINTRPGKPTILGVCDQKAVIGLPGNPVSALVNGYLFVAPVIEQLLGKILEPRPSIRAKLTVNLPSQAGREDWWPVRLVANGEDYDAEPVFGKSNLIFTLAGADGMLCILPDATGLNAGQMVNVILL